MPHIILEYSSNAPIAGEIKTVVEALHQSLVKSGIDKTRIKSRAILVNDYVVADGGDGHSMMHLTLLLLEGRTVETKRQYAEPLYKILKDAVNENPECHITLEVRDMAKDTYFL